MNASPEEYLSLTRDRRERCDEFHSHLRRYDTRGLLRGSFGREDSFKAGDVSVMSKAGKDFDWWDITAKNVLFHPGQSARYESGKDWQHRDNLDV